MRSAGSRDPESEAADWYARLEADDASDQDREEFQSWLQASPSHREAHEAQQSMLERVVDPAREAVLQAEATRYKRRTPVRRRIQVPLAWAAAAVVVLGLVGTWLLRGEGSETFVTNTAERRSLILLDGSTVHLNAQSRISVTLSAEKRSVALLDGEALFEVKPEEPRPFLVEVQDRVVRVVGTKFNVRTNARGTAVTVLEGLVRVEEAPDVEEPEQIELRAGQQVRAELGGQWGEVESVNPDWVTAWREGRLIYRGERLEEVLSDLNRYGRGRVLRAESEVAHLLVSGDFHLDDIPGSLEALEVILPVRFVRRGNAIVFAPR